MPRRKRHGRVWLRLNPDVKPRIVWQFWCKGHGCFHDADVYGFGRGQSPSAVNGSCLAYAEGL